MLKMILLFKLVSSAGGHLIVLQPVNASKWDIVWLSYYSDSETDAKRGFVRMSLRMYSLGDRVLFGPSFLLPLRGSRCFLPT